LHIPHYETVTSVKEALNKKIDASKYEVEGTLVIVDTENAFQKSSNMYNILLMINLLTKRAGSMGKNGLSVIANAGSFFLHENLEELVKHELSVPPGLEMKCKAICCYHKKDFEKLGTPQ